MSILYNQISKIINVSICDSESTHINFLKRSEESTLTRDENPQTHFSTYFLPYNPQNKQVFMVHHKKSGLWMSPGGHIDKDENLLDTLNREINEELGVSNFFEKLPNPFLLTVTHIENQTQPCKTHYDIWYLVSTDGSDFTIDPREFHETKWMSIKEAEKIVTEKANRKALEILSIPL